MSGSETRVNCVTSFASGLNWLIALYLLSDCIYTSDRFWLCDPPRPCLWNWHVPTAWPGRGYSRDGGIRRECDGCQQEAETSVSGVCARVFVYIRVTDFIAEYFQPSFVSNLNCARIDKAIGYVQRHICVLWDEREEGDKLAVTGIWTRDRDLSCQCSVPRLI